MQDTLGICLNSFLEIILPPPPSNTCCGQEIVFHIVIKVCMFLKVDIGGPIVAFRRRVELWLKFWEIEIRVQSCFFEFLLNTSERKVSILMFYFPTLLSSFQKLSYFMHFIFQYRNVGVFRLNIGSVSGRIQH